MSVVLTSTEGGDLLSAKQIEEFLGDFLTKKFAELLGARQVPCLLSARKAAKSLDVSEAYLAKLRSEGSGGPAWIKIGSSCLYHPDDLAAFVAARRRTSTRDVLEAA